MSLLKRGNTVLVTDAQGHAVMFAAGPDQGRNTPDALRACNSRAVGPPPTTKDAPLGHSTGIASAFAAACPVQQPIYRKFLKMKKLAMYSIIGLVATTSNAMATMTSTGYTATRYPIILVPGTSGLDEVVGGARYYYKIAPQLQAGGAKVYAAELPGANRPEVTGEYLVQQIKYVKATTGAAKVHLIGHSLGGPTIRYAAGVMPESVASVTSISGANGPLKSFELMQKAIDSGGAASGVVLSLTNGFMKILGFLTGKPPFPEDVAAEVKALTIAGSTEFAAKFPAGLPPLNDCSVKNGPELVNGIRYYSWAGGARSTNLFDISDPILVATGTITKLLEGANGANDGFVTVCSSRLGRQLGVYRMNHVDEINQVLGLVSPFEVSPVTLFREHANRLKRLGL